MFVSLFLSLFGSSDLCWFLLLTHRVSFAGSRVFRQLACWLTLPTESCLSSSSCYILTSAVEAEILRCLLALEVSCS